MATAVAASSLAGAEAPRSRSEPQLLRPHHRVPQASNDGMLVIILRHGERADFEHSGAWSQAWWDAHIDQRPWDPPLTSAGQAQAIDAGTLINSRLRESRVHARDVLVFTSPFKRCVQTAVGAASQLGTRQVLIDRALSEHLRADWFDPVIASRADFLLGAPSFEAAGALESPLEDASPSLAGCLYPEDDTALCLRADSIAASLAALAAGDSPPAAVILVTHGGVAGNIISSIGRLCEARDVPLPHLGFAAITTLHLKPTAGGSGLQLAASDVGQLPLRLTPSQTWFASQQPVWHRVLLPVIEERKREATGVISALELGSWEGASASWLLCHACDSSALSRLVCVDHFDKLRTPAGAERAAKFSHNTRLTGLWPRLEVVADFTVAALSRLLVKRREWDFIYVDASHEAADTLLDAMLAWKGLRQGGVIVFDDYLWPDHPHDSPLHPKPGIDAFLAVHSHELEVLHRGYQLMARKLVGPRFNF